jgi:hypothetical protein
VRRNVVIADGSRALWAEAHLRISQAVTEGWVAAGPAEA